MKAANKTKTQVLWCDIYPNMERKILVFSASSPHQRINYPKKRIWLTVEIPGDEELWPEIFVGPFVDIKNFKIEDP